MFQKGHILEPILSYDRGPPPCCYFCGQLDSLAGEEGTGHRQKECPSRLKRLQVDPSKREFLMGKRPNTYAGALRGQPRGQPREEKDQTSEPGNGDQNENTGQPRTERQPQQEKNHARVIEPGNGDEKYRNTGHSPRRTTPSPTLSRVPQAIPPAPASLPFTSAELLPAPGSLDTHRPELLPAPYSTQALTL